MSLVTRHREIVAALGILGEIESLFALLCDFCHSKQGEVRRALLRCIPPSGKGEDSFGFV